MFFLRAIGINVVIIDSMNKRVFPIAVIIILFLSPLEAESTLTYFTGFSYTNTILKGPAAWDHLDQINTLTGLSLSTPLEGTGQFNRKIRLAADIPLMASIRQLDGVLLPVLEVTGGSRLGFNLFFGPELPVNLKKDLFKGVLSAGPLIVTQSFGSALLITLGVEVGADARFSLNEKFYTGLGASLYYNFWGLHTAGDSSRYDIYTNGGMGIMINSFLGFRY
jgi:hypothetical protein